METYQEIKFFVCVHFALGAVIDPTSHQGHCCHLLGLCPNTERHWLDSDINNCLTTKVIGGSIYYQRTESRKKAV